MATDENHNIEENILPTSDPDSTSEVTAITDPKIDKAVDDIMLHESDEVLSHQDAQAFVAPKIPWYKRFFKQKKVWIPLVLFVVLLALFGTPWSRYKILGLFLKKSYSIQVIDSQTNLPVSAASVELYGKTVETDNHGKVTVKGKVGPATLSLHKKYYLTATEHIFIGLRHRPDQNFTLVATGRQVPLSVVNKISGAPVSNVQISAAGTTAKTDQNGTVTMVLPANASTLSGVINGSGFNKATVTIHITDTAVAANRFQLVPSGKVYVLSNASGKIDVVSANLDGSNLQTVLAGTGNEDPHSTVLMPSDDGKYLMLLTIRSKSGNQELDLIDTSNNDHLTMIDSGSAVTINPIGWSNQYFVYDIVRNNIPNWQSSAQILKSYDVSSQQPTTLDQTTAEGTGPIDFAYNSFSTIALLNNELVYAKDWYGDGFSNRLDNKSVSLTSIRPDGSNKQDIKDFAIPTGTNYNYNVVLEQATPTTVYLQVPTAPATYYEYSNRKLSGTTTVNDNNFYQSYQQYFMSPDGSQSFWSEARDGKNTLFLGDSSGDNPKQIANLSDYSPYGWYNNDYVLVTKSNLLYIMPTVPLKTGQQPLQITNYYTASTAPY